MSQDQPNPSDPQQPNQPGSPEQSEQQPPKKRKRRRWLRVMVVLSLLLIALVALLPTLAGLGPVRSIIVGKVNDNLNGTVEIQGWSLGWFSPISVSGVRVYDDQKRLILDVPNIRLGVSLMGAARSNFAMGDDNVIDVASFDLRVDENGRTNFDKLVKAAAAPEKSGGKPRGDAGKMGKLPDLSGKFVVNINQGTIEGPPPKLAGDKQLVLHLDPSSAAVTVTDINKPIESTVKLAYRDDQGKISTIQTSGTIDAVENNELAIETLSANQTIKLSKVNLAAAEPFLARGDMKTLKLGGIADGEVEMTAGGSAGLTARGELHVDQPMLAGGPLAAGDQFTSSKLVIPISITRTEAGGKTTIKIEKLGAQIDQASIAMTGEIAQEALTNIIAGKAPGADGSITLNADVTGVKALASQFKNTLQLQEGVSVTGGAVNEQLTVNITKENVTIAQKLVASAEGTNAGKAIRIQPITVTASATATPVKEGIPELRDLKLDVASSFAKVSGGGASLASMKIEGNADFAKLQAEIGQFVDMQGKQLQGTADFAVAGTGDVRQPDAPIASSGSVNLQSVKVIGILSQPIDMDRLAVAFGGSLTRKNSAPIGINNGSITITAGDPASPLLTASAGANVDLSDPKKITASNWRIQADTSDLAGIKKQYGGILPVLADQKIDITSGGFHIKGAGSYDGSTVQTTEPVALSIASLTATKAGQPIFNRETIRGNVNGSVTLGAGRISGTFVDLSFISASGLFNIAKAEGPLNFSMISKGESTAIDGAGALTVAANVKAILDIVQRAGVQVITPDQPQLRSGMLNGTLTLAKADKTTAKFDGKLSNLTVQSGGANALDKEEITVALNAVAPSDLNSTEPIAIDGKIGSSFVNATLADVKLLSAGETLDKLRSATIDAQVPDLAKLDALAQAFMPAAAPKPPTPTAAAAPAVAPIEPLKVTGGAASVKLNLMRDVAGKTTTLAVTDASITNLGLTRGKQSFKAAAPIVVKLSGKVNGDSFDKLASLNIDQLSGNAGFANFTASKPIVIRSPGAANASYEGEIRVDGTLERLTPLLAVLQGAEPLPYQGKFDASQAIGTSGSQVTLAGAINVIGFRVMDAAGKPVVTDDLAVRNNVNLDLNQHNFAVTALTVDMPKTRAVGVKFAGQVIDWTRARTIRGAGNEAAARLDLTYDAEKIWAIVKPMLSPETQQQYATLKVAGKFDKVYTISGALPERPTMSESLAYLNADGSFSLESLVLPQGLSISAFDLPFNMKNGVLTTLAAPESDARKLQLPPAEAGGRVRSIVANTAVANGGALNLDGFIVDMTQPDPLLSIKGRQILLRGVKLNPVLADSMGKIGALALLGTTDAEGLLSMTILACDRVPLGQLIRKEQSSEARIAISVENLQLNGVIPQGIAWFSDLGTKGIQGEVRSSTITLKDGKAVTDLTLQVLRPVKDPRTGERVMSSEPLRFAGTLNMLNLKLDSAVEFPPALIQENLRQAFPRGATIPLTGAGGKVEFNVVKFAQENALKGIIGGNAGDLLNDVLGGGNRRNEPQSPAPQPQPRDRRQAP